MIELNRDEAMLVRRALGLERARRVNRNRLMAHDNGDTIALMQSLTERGVFVRDPTADYGSMRCFRVTTAGALAIGKKLSPHRLTN